MSINLDTEKAEVMYKLARKNNRDHKYDRLERFKRFQNLDKTIKELLKIGWLLIYKKPMFIGIALNTQYKKDIVDFIETKLLHIKGMIR